MLKGFKGATSRLPGGEPITALTVKAGMPLQEADISMLHDMAKYLANEGDADDGRHNPIPHLFWWAWNSNSADTGGLVSSPNWDQVILDRRKSLLCAMCTAVCTLTLQCNGPSACQPAQ